MLILDLGVGSALALQMWDSGELQYLLKSKVVTIWGASREGRRFPGPLLSNRSSWISNFQLHLASKSKLPSTLLTLIYWIPYEHREFNRLKFCRMIDKFQHYIECFYMLYQMSVCYNSYFLKTYRNTVKWACLTLHYRWERGDAGNFKFLS